jgi:tetratricopeptide (TPR) repeat protein
MGVCIFCGSVASFDMANAIQIYWSGFFAILILTYFLVCACLGKYKAVMFPKDRIMKTICLLGVLEILYALLQLAGLVSNNYKYAYFSGSLNNPAIFGMLLSFCIIISIYYATRTEGRIRVLWELLSLLYGVFILLSDSRTAILASVCGIVAILVIESVSLQKLFSCKCSRYIGLISIVAFCVAMYYYKRNSADGRFLIWTVCMEMIKEKPLFGWGFDGYIAQYMNYQADYMNANPKSPFILLAGETQNPFNEFLHIAILYGVPCAAVFTGMIIFLVWFIKSRVNAFKSILLSTVCVLIVWCFFCYPLNISFVWLIILFVILCLVPNEIHLYQPKICVGVVLALSMCTLYMLGVSAIHDFRRLYVQESSVHWDYNQIKETYERMYSDYNEDLIFLYNYGALLHFYGDYQRSLEVFQQGTKYLSDYNMMLLMGDDYQKLERYEEAIACYKRAGEMIPSRYLPLYYQMKLYQENEDWDESHRIAYIILRKKNKIKKSRITQQVIKEATECLED